MMSTVNTAVAASDAPSRSRPASPKRALWVALLRRWGWPFTIALVLAGAGVLLLAGYGLVAAVAVAGTGLAVPLMHRLPRQLPPLNHLGTRNLVQVESETRQLLAFGICYPIILIPVVIWAREAPIPMLPTWPALSMISLQYILVGKVVLLGIPTILLAARMGQMGRQLGMRRIGTLWRWAGPVVPFTLLMVVIARLTSGAGSLPLLAYPLLFGVAVLQTGFPDEAFYRVLLQTRLELLLGTRSGIAVSSILYGLMQVPASFAFVWLLVDHNPGHALLLAFAAAIGFQTVLGLLFGYMWMRYRNAWVNVIAHAAFGTVVLAALLAH